jgi:hypothetical protein
MALTRFRSGCPSRDKSLGIDKRLKLVHKLNILDKCFVIYAIKVFFLFLYLN